MVPKGGRPIGGRFYNEGTLIGMLPRLVHQDPRAYGHDANQWKPERWLEQDRSTLEAYNLTVRDQPHVINSIVILSAAVRTRHQSMPREERQSYGNGEITSLNCLLLQL